MWEQQQREAEVTWQALKRRIDAMLAQRQQQHAPPPPHAPAPHPRAAPAGLRAARAAGARPLAGQRPASGPRRLGGAASNAGNLASPAPPGASAEEQRLFAALAAQREAIQGGHQELAALREELEAHLARHPEAALPPALAPMSGALSDVR